MRYQDAFDGYPGERRAGPGYQDQFDYWTTPDPQGQVRRSGGFASLGAQARTSGVFPSVPDESRAVDYPTMADEIPAARNWYDDLDGQAGYPASGRRSRGLLAGGVTGFLAAALAIGVANLAAAFVRPQASPIIAVGGAFIDRTPPALKNFAVAKFGENDKNMLLLGMYVTIALLAVFIGMIAWRHISVGVAGIGLFGAFGAFVAYTRPESRVTDVIPSLVGGIVGIIAIAILARWATHQRQQFAAGPPYAGAPYAGASYGPRHRAAGTGWVA
jgi:hypothetical protein